MASRYGGITGSKQISDDFQNINVAFENVQDDMDANKAVVDKHLSSTTAHAAQNITYTGDIIGATNVKQALDNTKQTIDDLILGSGDSGPEVAAARGGYQTLGDRLDSSDHQLADIAINVKKYGAVGDGVTDDSPAVSMALADALSSGGVLWFPSGQYLFLSSLEVDLTGPFKGLLVKGASPESTILLNGIGSEHIIKVRGLHFSYLRISDLSFVGQDLSANKGLDLTYLSETYLDNVSFRNLFLGMSMTDVVRARFVSCVFDQNKNGLYGYNQVNESTPNAIDFFGCTFYGNAECGLYFKGGCNINFFGGTIETNGHLDTGANRWGIQLDDLGRYGGAGAAFYSTYFEGNANVADVWINHHNHPATYSFHGCTFNKFAPPKNNQHNIRVDAKDILGNTAPAKVVVTGCTFRDIGNTPSESTRYIGFYSGGTPIQFEQMGNIFQNQVELPDPPSNRIYAAARFILLSSSPSIFRGFNIDSISKNGVGDYTIHFIFPSVVPQKIYSFNMDIMGFTQVTDESITSVRVKTYNTSGAPADPGALWLTCLE